jgi:hypothetical protein
MLHLTWPILYSRNRDFVYGLPLASPVTIARATGVVVGIILLAFSPVVPQIEAAFSNEFEMDMASGTHITRECASECLIFHT